MATTTHDHDHAMNMSTSTITPQHQDLNVRSAYMHVLADAATSVLAIVALFGGKLWGSPGSIPLMGIAGAVLVAVWAQGLLRDSGRVLLDAEMDAPVVREVREVIEQGKVPARITDLHVWRVGRANYACVVSLTTSSQNDGDYFRRELAAHEELAHITVEVDHVRPEARFSAGTGSSSRRTRRSTSSCDSDFSAVCTTRGVEMRRQHLQEVVHVSAQQYAAAKARPGGVHREQVRARRAP